MEPEYSSIKSFITIKRELLPYFLLWLQQYCLLFCLTSGKPGFCSLFLKQDDTAWLSILLSLSLIFPDIYPMSLGFSNGCPTETDKFLFISFKQFFMWVSEEWLRHCGCQYFTDNSVKSLYIFFFFSCLSYPFPRFLTQDLLGKWRAGKNLIIQNTHFKNYISHLVLFFLSNTYLPWFSSFLDEHSQGRLLDLLYKHTLGNQFQWLTKHTKIHLNHSWIPLSLSSWDTGLMNNQHVISICSCLTESLI